MNRTKIEWADYSVNPIKGICKNDCFYCYAKRMYKRFGWDPHIRPDFTVFAGLEAIKPSRIFIGSMHDIFGEWVPATWIRAIISSCGNYPQHTFLFLTKNPKRYSKFKFPQNCWLGTSIENDKNVGRLYDLCKATKGRNKIFISFEPLLSGMTEVMYYRPELKKLDWIIIGGLTPKPVHEDKWVLDLIDFIRILTYSAHINLPIFLKDNLKFGVETKEFPVQ